MPVAAAGDRLIGGSPQDRLVGERLRKLVGGPILTAARIDKADQGDDQKDWQPVKESR